MPRYNHVSKKARSRARKRFEANPRFQLLLLGARLGQSVTLISTAMGALGDIVARNVEQISKAFGIPPELLNTKPSWSNFIEQVVTDYSTDPDAPSSFVELDNSDKTPCSEPLTIYNMLKGLAN